MILPSEITRKIDGINYDNIYDHALFLIESVDWFLKPKWLPWPMSKYLKSSTTVSDSCIHLHPKFFEWDTNKQTDMVLHELKHVQQYENKAITWWKYLTSDQIAFNAEYEANYENIRFRVRNGELDYNSITKFKRPNAHLNNKIYYRAWDAAKELNRHHDTNFVLNLFVQYRDFALLELEDWNGRKNETCE